MKCTRCRKNRAEVELPSHNAAFCRECYEVFFHNQVEKAIKKWRMFRRSEKVLVAVSGGKDSMTLWYLLSRMGYNVTGLFINLGIDEFSEKAQFVVESFANSKGLKLTVVDLKKEGIPIPDVIRVTRKKPCAVCGQIKRYYFNQVAIKEGFDAVATGHNLDDETSRLFANLLHWKVEYLLDQSPFLPEEKGFKRKVKPFYRLTEFEIAAYAFIHGIEYLMDACPFSKRATFSFYKKELNRIEHHSPGTKLDFYQGFLDSMRPILLSGSRSLGSDSSEMGFCRICGYPSFGELCSVCILKERVKMHLKK